MSESDPKSLLRRQGERVFKSVRNRVRVRELEVRGNLVRWTHALMMDCGPSLRVGRNVRIEVYGRLVLGRGVFLSDGCSLSVGPGAALHLGDGVFIGRNTVVAAHREIRIGTRTMVAEHCSIRDHDHELEPEARLKETETQATPVTLGENVWVGAGVRVLRGTRIGDGSVVAANAVVRREIPPRVVVGGIPARILKELTQH